MSIGRVGGNGGFEWPVGRGAGRLNVSLNEIIRRTNVDDSMKQADRIGAIVVDRETHCVREIDCEMSRIGNGRNETFRGTFFRSRDFYSSRTGSRDKMNK